MRDRCWSAKQIAEIIGVSDRYVRKLAATQSWPHRDGKGGKRFYLSALPEDMQAKIALPPVKAGGELTLSPQPAAALLDLAKWQRDTAEARYAALQLFEQFFTNSTLLKTKAEKSFCTRWQELASPGLLDIIKTLCPRKLQRWAKLHREGGIPALAPKHGQHRIGKTKISKDLQAKILTAYLTDTRTPIATLYNIAVHAEAERKLGEGASLQQLDAAKTAIRAQLSINTVQRFVRNNTTSGMRLLTRGGKGGIDKMRPFVSRTRELLAPNDIWVSDGHDANNFILRPSPAGDKFDICRPVLVVWMDERSRYITGYAVGWTESTDLIQQSLVNAVEQYGAPEEVYVDNGKAYINKVTSVKYLAERHLKLYGSLGCKVRTARPYNAREKSVESFWRTFDNYAKTIPGYTGKNTLDKPQGIDLAVKQKRLWTLEQYSDWIAHVIAIYNSTPHQGESMDKHSPVAVYHKLLGQVRRIADEQLLYWRLHHLPDFRIIGAGGKVRVNGQSYTHPALIMHVNSKVEIALDPKDIVQAYVFLGGKLLCIAEAEQMADYTTTPRTIAALKQTKKAQKEIKEHKQAIAELQGRINGAMLVEAVASAPKLAERPRPDKKIDFLKIQ